VGQAAHRQEPPFKLSMVCLDRIVRILLDNLQHPETLATRHELARWTPQSRRAAPTAGIGYVDGRPLS
jgi:hypothetical protein